MAAETKQRTRGGDLLSRCPDSHAEIAAKVGIDKSLVTRWISGARRPTDAQTARLDELYGIPPAAWTEVSTVPKKRAARADRPLPTAPPLDDGDDDESNTDRLRRFIRDGIRELEFDTELSGVKRAEALKKLCDAQVSLDKSTGENALSLARIVAHPEFKRVVQKITEGIAVCPTCLRRAIDVIEEATG